MYIKYELNLKTFDAWSGAIDTLERIENAGKCEELESILENLYPDGMTETELNDLLWFEKDLLYEWLQMKSEDQIYSEIDDLTQEISDLTKEIKEIYNDFNADTENVSIEDCKEIWDCDYKPNIEKLKSLIEDTKKTIEELKECL